jgi:hypothetical protein
MTLTPMLRTALQLARRGLHVFPCNPAGKTPATLHGYKDATRDPAVIETWWRRVPSYNVAVATGRVSGIIVVDIDNEDAETRIKELEADYSPLPATVESITSRGRHLFFKCPEQEVRNSTGKVALGVDIRASGGYVLVPPSVHPCGKPYAWSVDSAPIFAELPQWLLTRITTPPPVAKTTLPDMANDWVSLIRNGAPEGCRNSSLARLIGHLLNYNNVEETLEIALLVNEARFRPPLDTAEVMAVASSITARYLKERTV